MSDQSKARVGDWEGGVPVITSCLCLQSIVDTAKDLSLKAWFLLHLNFAPLDPSVPCLLLKCSPCLCLVPREHGAQLEQGKGVYGRNGKPESGGCPGEVCGDSGRPSHQLEMSLEPTFIRATLHQMCCLNGHSRQTGPRFSEEIHEVRGTLLLYP